MEHQTATESGQALSGRACEHDGAAPAPVVGPLRPVPAQRRRGEPRPVPILSEAYAHLSITEVRELRRTLNEQEDKVSYWRRLLQGRHDVIAGGGSGAHAQQARLGTMLTAERVGAGRSVLAHAVPLADLPALPRVDELWQRQLDPWDADSREELLEDLRTAEEQLSAYRSALHARIAEATGELIARYRAEPTLCLSVLPSSPTAG
jgi:hypothetical protein